MTINIKEYITNIETLKSMVDNLHKIAFHTEECIDNVSAFMDYVKLNAERGNAILDAKIKSGKTSIKFTVRGAREDGKSYIIIEIDHLADSRDSIKYTLTSGPAKED